MKKTGLIFCLLPLTLSLFGWGGGHTDHAQLVLQYLPREISSRWSPADQKTFRNRWAHSPDSSVRIGEEILRMIGPDSVRVLNECRIQTYYKFHLESGRAAAFLLLVRAFREKNDPAALFFSGVLQHSLADTSAFNHGPLIHFLTYTRYDHVRYPKLKLDLSNMRGNSVFKEKLAARLAGFHPDGGQKSLRETLLSLMLEEIDSNAFMCAREDRLVSTRPDGSPSDAALDAMADVAAYQTRIGVNAICAAWRLARSGEDAGLSASDLEIRAYRKLPKEKRKLSLYSEYERRKGEKIARRDPRTDAVYAGLFNPGKSSPETKKIGLVCEATYAMDQAFLGFGSKFILAMIGRTLQNNGMEVEAIPLFDLRTRKLSPTTLPLVILCTGGGAPGFAVRTLKTYVDQGGRILVIGGRSDLNLTGLAPFCSRKPDSAIPVTSTYGKAHEKLIGQMRIIPAGPLARHFPEKSYSFRANPNTANGWNKPFSSLAIRTDDPAVLPLFELNNGTEQFCIAAAFQSGKQIRGAYLPQYLLMPFLFSNDAEMPDWSRPVLDSFSRTFLLPLVRRMIP